MESGGLDIEESMLQRRNAPWPIDVNVFGRVTEIRFGQSSKAWSAIVVILLPIVTIIILPRTAFHGRLPRHDIVSESLLVVMVRMPPFSVAVMVEVKSQVCPQVNTEQRKIALIIKTTLFILFLV